MCFFCCTFTFNAYAQIPDGSIAPNFSFKDINGNAWNLYNLLAQGKTVVVDVSTTWCGPCWDFHRSKALDSLNKKHGPNGTVSKEIVVLFIEADEKTTMADLQGSTSGTQGNWISGTSYPIIDLNATERKSFESDYQINGYPTVFSVCPDKIYRQNARIEHSEYLYKELSTKCFAGTPAADASLHNSREQKFVSCDSIQPEVILANYSTSPLTSAKINYTLDGTVQKTYNWTGNLATYANTTIKNIKIGTGFAGNHKLVVTVSSPNAAVDTRSINDTAAIIPYTKLSPTGANLVTESFSGATFPPSGWGFQQGNYWDKRKWSATPYGKPGNGAVLNNHFNWSNSPQFNTNGNSLYLPCQKFTGINPKLTFDLAHAHLNENYDDQLIIKVSTDCGLNWTTVYMKQDNDPANALETVTISTYPNNYTPASQSDWRNETVSLAAYAGKPNVYIKFESFGSGTNVFLDNINIVNVSGVEENHSLSYMSLSPNPAADQVQMNLSLTKTEPVIVQIYNVLGELQYMNQWKNLPEGDNQLTIPLEKMTNGIYHVIVHAGSGSVEKKLIITH